MCPVEHGDISPICREIFKKIDENYGRVEEKIDKIIQRGDKTDCRWEDHLKTSVDYRIKVDRTEVIVDDLKTLKKWLIGTICTVVGAVMIWLVSWGEVTNQIRVNTGRITNLERMVNI